METLQKDTALPDKDFVQKDDHNLDEAPLDLLTEAKSNLVFNVGTYGFYFPAVVLLFIAQFILSDCNSTNPNSGTSNNIHYTAYQQVNEAQAVNNLNLNMAALRIKIAALSIICISMIIIVSVIVVPMRVSILNKILICIPFLIFAAVTGLQVVMLHKQFDRIANNEVGTGYNSVMQWISITHIIFAMIMWYNTLLINLLSIKVFFSLVMMAYNYQLHKYTQVFITDG